jgi:hypothetical protein
MRVVRAFATVTVLLVGALTVADWAFHGRPNWPLLFLFTALGLLTAGNFMRPERVALRSTLFVASIVLNIVTFVWLAIRQW